MRRCWIVLWVGLATACSRSQSERVQAEPAPAPAPVGAPGTYAGRPIAGTCSHLGAAWLDRPEREAREQPDRVLDLLGIDAGSTVADVGAGTGYFTTRLAARVGASGQVIATEVQPEMKQLLDGRLAGRGIRNVRTVLAGTDDAALPAACCDVVLMVDVYHELADPPAVMAGVRAALRPAGRLVLVEYKSEDPSIPIKDEHRMALPQIQRELTSLGFTFVTSHEELPDQRVVVFRGDR